MRITLTVTEGPHQGRTFTFTEHDTFLVGRSKQAHFRFTAEDKYFSRHHFVVEINPPHCRIMDLGSRNGTYINGERTTSTDLCDGDIIKAGRSILRATIESTRPVAESCDPGGTSTVGHGQYSTIYPSARSDDRPPASESAASTEIYAPSGLAVPGYRILQELGRGGMGVVYHAIRLADGTSVAIKTIQPQCATTPDHVARFLREANILRQLDHPNIVALRDMGESGARLFIAMDYVQGTDAAGLVKRSLGGLPIGRAVAITCQLLEALDYAHAKGFVHRDIKPGNMLVGEGKHDPVKLADFGLARVYQSASFSGLTMQGDHGGTYAFMPPEQITNYREALPTNDLYSAGATLYNLLTGSYVYDFPATVERRVLMLLQDETVPIRSRRHDIPAGLAEVVHRALAREPGKRFANARAMHEALAPFRAIP